MSTSCTRLVASSEASIRLESRSSGSVHHDVERLASRKLHQQRVDLRVDRDDAADLVLKVWLGAKRALDVDRRQVRGLLHGPMGGAVIPGCTAQTNFSSLQLRPKTIRLGACEGRRSTKSSNIDQTAGPPHELLLRCALHRLDKRGNLVDNGLPEHLASVVECSQLLPALIRSVQQVAHNLLQLLDCRHVGF